MMRPCLLLLIAEGDANHGYELHEGLKRLGLDMGDDTARVYRALRKLEEDDLVTSNWDTGGNGPARRNYAITAAGMQYLDDWKEVLQHTRDQLSAIADRLSKLV
jgi:poly-beta-hydroxybutyrate-responsive repressor